MGKVLGALCFAIGLVGCGELIPAKKADAAKPAPCQCDSCECFEDGSCVCKDCKCEGGHCEPEHDGHDEGDSGGGGCTDGSCPEP